MRFFCDRCKTRYTIDDAKVRGKVLKIRCKNCGNVMTVSDAGGSSVSPSMDTSSAAARALSHRRGGPRSAGGPGGEREVSGGSKRGTGSPGGSRGQRAPKGGAAARITFRTPKAGGGRDTIKRESRGGAGEPGAAPGAGASGGFDGGLDQQTMISDPGFDLGAIRREAESIKHGSESSDPPMVEEPEEWYLADDNGQWGPMTFSELAARVKRGEPGPNPQAWRDGMAEWQDLHDVPELRPYIKHLPPPRSPTGSYAKLGAEAKRDLLEEGGPTLQDHTPGVGRGRGVRKKSPPKKDVDAGFFGSKGLGKTEGEAPSVSKPAQKSGVASDLFSLQPEKAAQDDGDDSLSDALGGFASAPAMSGQPSAAISPPRDTNRNLVIIFAIFGGIVALAMVVLVAYVVLRDNGSSTQKPAKEKIETAKAGPVEIKEKEAGREAESPVKKADDDSGGDEKGEEESEELVMDEVAISLSRSTSSSRKGSTKPGKKPKPEEGSTAGSSSSSLGGGFGTPGLYGSGGSSISGRRSDSPSVESPSKSRKGSSRVASRPVTKPEVMAVVSKNVHRLKRCYERAVRLHPAQLRQARLKVNFRVNTSGKVTSVNITPGKYRGFSLGPCIVSSVRGWKFPPSTKPYGTVFPVNFVGR